jgi:hypothetical protein
MEQLFLCSFFLYSKEVGVEEGKYRYSDSLWGIFLAFKVRAIFCINFYNGFYT